MRAGCRWLPSNYVVPLTDDEIAKLEEELDEESAAGGSDGDDERALAAPAGSQELYGSTPADGVDVHAYWVPRVRPLAAPGCPACSAGTTADCP